ncbi:glycosyltransferase [Flavobacterium phragmitis]|uniref:Glycosyltransferase involved in cell wall bisynthesis n=1 Tax=Flavobacterium phragmitis TaxID=739143 RepID=A0A1I1UNC5_9FLAO|nr:glycosyltransferase [Flavobacterium phragmitis]SFD72362.1 Glycosyltransferase involved in cell wall bisynthesis [Flavobacterium phragmitis]
MRVLQLIDSLEVGGAERMAVNYANALSNELTFSGLIATRKEGALLNQIGKDVSFLCLHKTQRIDLKAIFKLRKYIVDNKVDILHAHSSSFFIAVLVKLTLVKVKIIWHDHYGTRVEESLKENKVLFLFSLFFSTIFVVNNQLKEWNERNLLCKKVIFIPNFTSDTREKKQITNLKGKEGKRIVILANLKKPKNHIIVIKAYFDLKLQDLDWSLHLIGKDYFDFYSKELKEFIKLNLLENHIHLYGERNDIDNILSQSSVGILASTNEGFPVTLLEYARSRLAVISTNAGFCSEIIQNDFNGLLFDPQSDLELKKQLQKIISNESFREKISINFNVFVKENYSKEIVIERLIMEYKKIRL